MQTKRVAKADAEAALIKAYADIKIDRLKKRTITSLINEEAKNQNNMEEISLKAIANLSETAKPENIENDWLVYFFDRARLVSDNEMQILWANILAGEANSPGAFSKPTIYLVSKFDKKDAKLFTDLGAFC